MWVYACLHRLLCVHNFVWCRYEKSAQRCKFAHDFQVESPWLVEPYSIAILIALNAVLLLGCVIIFLLYLFIYRFCCQGHFVLEPLWPVMTTYQYDVEGVETQKYLAAVLRGRAVIGKCYTTILLF